MGERQRPLENLVEKGYPMIDLMNELGFDIAVIGNHEFDFGFQNFLDLKDQKQMQKS